MLRRLGPWAVAVALVAIAVATPSARAAIQVQLDHATAAPGDVVRGRTVGAPMRSLPVSELGVYLAPVEVVTSGALPRPGDEGVIHVGAMRADEHGVGFLALEIPDAPAVDAGKQFLLGWCDRCPTVAGRGQMIVLASLEIVSTTGRDDDSRLGLAIAAGWAVVLAAAATWWVRARARPRRADGAAGG